MSQTATPSMISVTLPDGSKKEVPRGTTAYDIAKSISPRLADAALSAKIKPASWKPASASETSQPGDEKSPASMHVQQSQSQLKDGWAFTDLSKPLEEDVEL